MNFHCDISNDEAILLQPQYEKVARLFNGANASHPGIILMTRVDCALTVLLYASFMLPKITLFAICVHNLVFIMGFFQWSVSVLHFPFFLVVTEIYKKCSSFSDVLFPNFVVVSINCNPWIMLSLSHLFTVLYVGKL